MNLFWDESKLNSYFENFLIPIATEFKSHPALLAWDIINEPEGLLFVGKTDPEPCFDTRPLIGAGAGWDHDFVPMENILRFINHHAAVIKSIEGNTALVTAASYREFSNINAYGYKNFYSDDCLIKGGGFVDGTIDFYQIHTYNNCQCNGGDWEVSSPMNNTPLDYNLDKPIVIGELSSVCSNNNSPQSMFTYLYESEYDGAWGWQMIESVEDGSHCSDGTQRILSGTAAIKGRTDHGEISVRL